MKLKTKLMSLFKGLTEIEIEEGQGLNRTPIETDLDPALTIWKSINHGGIS
jgi:hypothetical protein